MLYLHAAYLNLFTYNGKIGKIKMKSWKRENERRISNQISNLTEKLFRKLLHYCPGT